MSKIQDGIYGVLVGDMLGVPVEFVNRQELQNKPVTGPQAGGPYEQPIGSWSDDGALTLALADALKNGYNLSTIARNFIDWWVHKKYTSHGTVFDIGRQTRMALNDVLKILESGDTEALEYLHFDANENTNGNGSLMRILPLYFYLKDKGIEDNFKIIWQVSALTHPHVRSALACLFYLIMLDELSKEGVTPKTAYRSAQNRMRAFMSKNPDATPEASHFSRLLDYDVSELPEEEIRSSAYVIDTLEASQWCLLTTTSFEEAVLKAVNLGDDSDTTGAVTGGLAGVYYGFEAIPKDWIAVLPNKEALNDICQGE
jgi:ADP-ribosyl-[dinitrogen reductase] hydrolase